MKTLSYLVSMLSLCLILIQPAAAENIGFYFGTFDPPHNGHLTVINMGLKQLKIDKLYVLPNYDPGHKPDATNFEDRYQMVKLMLAAHPQADKLTSLPIPTYAAAYAQNADDLIGLLIAAIHHENSPQDRYYHLTGTDSLNKMVSYGKLPTPGENRIVAVFPRVGYSVVKTPLLAAAEARGQVMYVQLRIPELSSSAIRHTFASQNHSQIKDVIPEPVWEFIMQNGLYQTSAPDPNALVPAQ